nr:uncharacterized protein LOC104119940 [Nicotiana tomentosiformis]
MVSSFPNDMMNAPECTICLEVVLDNVGRSITKLHCGHFFHTDCIGSEFNNRGRMQCPNCRKIEEAGNWRWFAGPQNEDPNEQQNNIIDDEEYPQLSPQELLMQLRARLHLYNQAVATNMRIPYFQHQFQLPGSPHPAIASMMARRRQAAATSSVPVDPIPVNYGPPPSPEQAQNPLPAVQELSLASGSGTSADEEHQLPAYHYHYGFKRN